MLAVLSLPVIPFDPERMLFGSEPALFYLEILVRIILVYTFALLLVRWVGSRSLSQLSVVEFLLVVALGSAVGDPLFYPEVPVLHALLAIAGVVVINKCIDRIMLRSRAAQRRMDGTPVDLIRDCHLMIENAARRNLAPAEIFEQLRLDGICNLGEVEAAYIEPNGEISVFRRDIPRRGLPIVPPTEFFDGVYEKTCAPGLCCGVCGRMPATSVGPCPGCGKRAWRPAAGPEDTGGQNRRSQSSEPLT